MNGKLLMLGVAGHQLSNQEKEIFQRVQPGGYILFGRNFQSATQVRALTDSLREISYDDPIITVDQEGGRVSRTREIGIEPPSAQDLRDKGNTNLMAVHGEITAEILRILGFNMCLSPVLDISYDDNADNALRGRCWGRDTEEVIRNAGIYNRYMRKKKMHSCAKHFPSCGLADVDPHHSLPHVDKKLEDMMQTDIAPYTALMGELDSIMTCHAHFSDIDPETPGLPGSLSKNLIQGIIRDRLNYKGLVICDDLDMGAIGEMYTRGNDIKMAIEAGNDMAMICHQTVTSQDALSIVDEVDSYRLEQAHKQINKFRKKLRDPLNFSEIKWKQLNADIMDLRIETLGEELAKATEAYKWEKQSPVEDY